MTTTALAVIEPLTPRELVNQIQETKELINSLLESQGKDPMFVESKASAKYRAKMATPCLQEDNYIVFIYDLNKYIREESCGGKTNRAGYRLGNYEKEPFVEYLSCLRNNKAHDENTKYKLDIILQGVYQIYLGKTTEPETKEDFMKMQMGLLSDCNKFLKKISNDLSSVHPLTSSDSENKVYGIIGKDKNGEIYCENILLPYSLGKYEGCKCVVSTVVPNGRKSNNKIYPKFSFSPDRIYINREGLIRQGEDGNLYCGKIAFGSDAAVKEGQKVKVDAIRTTFRDGQLLETADEFTVLPNDYMLRSEPDIELNTEYEVQIDKLGNTHVGNVIIWKKKDCLEGDVVKITKILPMPKEHRDKKNSYPFFAAKLEMVYDANGITKIYTVAKDKAGRLHADSILLPKKIRCKEGDRIMIFQIVENPSENTNEIYPLMAHKAVVLNTNLPGAELKAEAVVSKYEKYVKPGLKWLASVFVAIIIIILGRGNLIQKD